MSRKRKQSFCSINSNSEDDDCGVDGLALDNSDEEWLPDDRTCVTSKQKSNQVSSNAHETNDSSNSHFNVAKLSLINANVPRFRFWSANTEVMASQMPNFHSTFQPSIPISLTSNNSTIVSTIRQDSANNGVGKPEVKRLKLSSFDEKRTTTLANQSSWKYQVVNVSKIPKSQPLSIGQVSFNSNSNSRIPQYVAAAAPVIRPTILRKYNVIPNRNFVKVNSNHNLPLSFLSGDVRSGTLPLKPPLMSHFPSGSTGFRYAAPDLTSGQKNVMISLKYSQVPCRAGDILVGEKCLQLVECSSNTSHKGVAQRLRTSAKFLCDLGSALVKDAYQSDFEKFADRDRKLRNLANASGVGANTFKRRSKSKGQRRLSTQSAIAVDEKEEVQITQLNSESNHDEFDVCDSVQQDPASDAYWQSVLNRDMSIPTSHLRMGLKHRCTSCQFASCCEVSLLLHYEQGHQDFSGVYRCAFCLNVCRDAASFQDHMTSVHDTQAKPLARLRPPHTQCTLCDYEVPFEVDDLEQVAVTLQNHMRRCFSYGKCRNHDYVNLLRPSLDDLNLVFFNDGMTHAFLFGFFVRLMSVNGSTKSSSALRRGLQVNKKAAAVAAAAPLANSGGGLVADTANIQVCELCNGLTSDRKRLLNHMRMQHDVQVNKSVACRACDKKFWTFKGLTQHIDCRGDDRCSLGRLCPVCRRPFLYTQLYHHLAAAHMRVLEDQLMAGQCLICPDEEAAVCFVSLTLHLEQVHGLRLASYVEKPLRKERYFFCDLKADSLHLASNAFDAAGMMMVLDEKSGHVPHRLFECSQCSFSFFTSNQLRNHVLRFGHFFTCFRCPSSMTTSKAKTQFKTAEELAGHLCISHAKERDRCQLCEERPLRGESFSAHVRIKHLRACKVRLSRLRHVICGDGSAGRPTVSIFKPSASLESQSFDVQVGTLDTPILLE